MLCEFVHDTNAFSIILLEDDQSRACMYVSPSPRGKPDTAELLMIPVPARPAAIQRLTSVTGGRDSYLTLSISFELMFFSIF